jgi:hypothetical protein
MISATTGVHTLKIEAVGEALPDRHYPHLLCARIEASAAGRFRIEAEHAPQSSNLNARQKRLVHFQADWTARK